MLQDCVQSKDCRNRQIERLRSIIDEKGHRHINHRKSTSAKLWNIIFQDIEDCLKYNCFPRVSGVPPFELRVCTERITLITHKGAHSKFVSVDRNEVLDDTVSRLKTILEVYAFYIVNKKDLPGRRFDKDVSCEAEYVIDFADL